MAETVYAIYPAIGIARVGNAPDAFYIGPETYNGLPTLPDRPDAPFQPSDFRDANGLVRRQAARFRIYRSVDGGPAEEVTVDTPDVAEIRWSVHLANKKASWYTFQTYLGEYGYAPNHSLRNADVKATADRQKLIIDPGPRSIAGRNSGGPGAPVEFSRTSIPPGYHGNFPPPTLKPYAIDTLGGLRTDGQGRLLVLGGHGHAGSTIDPPAIQEYANNDGWFDDTADGPVTATVVLKGAAQPVGVTPAWVLVGPPGYAPQIPNLVTLYDTIFDASVRHQHSQPDIFENGFWKPGPDGYKPSYERDIKPILERGMTYPWVTAIPPKPHRFDLGKLGDPNPALNQFRQFYLGALRAPGYQNQRIGTGGVTMMPYLAGDDCLGPGSSEATPQQLATSKYLTLTETQYFFLQQWADGYFIAGPAPAPHPGEQLTRAVLENCVGGAFSPGIEMTWISRNPAIYTEPFRIRVRSNPPDPLSLGFDPLAGMEPGDVCRYMAVPWQADFNECSSQPIDGRIFWWWPAQRPEFVYLPPVPTALRAEPSPEIGKQVAWVGSDYDQNAANYISFADDLDMVKLWDQLGFVFNIGTADDPHFVEVERRLPRPDPVGDD
ncbi:MAG TPA: LodA/GoxA family CTQ-dependent oxidase [Acetobacteraceae bacterium]|nr:LodA/GoxA family CTQ-dependent oxidase [Acetobacteraceae bacterium]